MSHTLTQKLVSCAFCCRQCHDFKESSNALRQRPLHSSQNRSFNRTGNFFAKVVFTIVGIKYPEIAWDVVQVLLFCTLLCQYFCCCVSTLVLFIVKSQSPILECPRSKATPSKAGAPWHLGKRKYFNLYRLSEVRT